MDMRLMMVGMPFLMSSGLSVLDALLWCSIDSVLASASPLFQLHASCVGVGGAQLKREVGLKVGLMVGG